MQAWIQMDQYSRVIAAQHQGVTVSSQWKSIPVHWCVLITSAFENMQQVLSSCAPVTSSADVGRVQKLVDSLQEGNYVHAN